MEPDVSTEAAQEDGETYEDERGHWQEPDMMGGINQLMEVLATMGVDEPTRRGQVFFSSNCIAGPART
eukprot:3739155-Pyramimonas_sp.AAC.1